jgi:hypothetical protein
VGIGMATPGAPLDIFTNNLADAILIRGNDNANVRIRMVNSGAGGEEFALSAGIPSASNSSFVIRSVTAASNRYIINQTGEHAWATNAGTAMTLNSTGLGLGGVPSGVNRFAVFNGATQALTLDTSGNLLVGTTTAFSTLTGSNQLRVNAGGLQTISQAISAGIATDIATSGLGGLAVVTANNATGQYSALVLFNFSSGATIVSVQNATGSVITYGISGGRLQVTSSLPLTTLITTCIRV